jgi:hypothetical protein
MPMNEIEFLGIILYTKQTELRMSETRLNEVKWELAGWIDSTPALTENFL